MLPELNVTVLNPVGKFEVPPTNKVPPEAIVNAFDPVKVYVPRFNDPLIVRLLAAAAALSVTVCPL